MLKKYILIFLIIISKTTFAQLEYNYVPIKAEKIDKTAYKKSLETKLKTDVDAIKSKYKKKIEDIYWNKYDFITASIDSGYFYFDDTINIYFQNILENIKKSNPTLNTPGIKIYVSRATYPNAYCVGEGSLVFNIGLLRYMHNESQIAFIICHELAHQIQDHVMTAAIAGIEKLYSKETQAELRKIKYSEYGTYTKALSLAKAYVFDNRKHSRLHESEADSLAYLYLKNTKYDENEAFTALALLDSIDNEKYTDSIQLPKFFNYQELPFKNSWIMEEKKFIFAEKDSITETEKDSLKTHPDCKKRIEALSKIRTTPSYGKLTFIQSAYLFQKLVDYSDFECINNRLEDKNLDGAFYLTLKLLNKYPDNVYLHKSIDQCFSLLIDGLTNHTLNRYLDLPTPFDEKDFKIVVRFLNNIRLSDATTLKRLHKEKYLSKG